MAEAMNGPKLTAFAAPEGRVSPFGRPGGTDICTHCLMTPVNSWPAV